MIMLAYALQYLPFIFIKITTMHDRVHPARDRKPPDWLKDYDTGDARTRDSTVSF